MIGSALLFLMASSLMYALNDLIKELTKYDDHIPQAWIYYG